MNEIYVVYIEIINLVTWSPYFHQDNLFGFSLENMIIAYLWKCGFPHHFLIHILACSLIVMSNFSNLV